MTVDTGECRHGLAPSECAICTPSVELDDGLDEMLAAVCALAEGSTYAEAARQWLDANDVPDAILIRFAVVGLAHRARGWQKTVYGPRDRSARKEERQRMREKLVEHLVEPLKRLERAANGRMKRLDEFSLVDHRAAIVGCHDQIDGFTAKLDFHEAAVKACVREGVEQIAKLPKDEQLRLEAML